MFRIPSQCSFARAMPATCNQPRKFFAATPCCFPRPAHCAATKLAMPVTQQLLVLLPPVATAAAQTVLVVLTWNPAGYCNTPVGASAGQRVCVLYVAADLGTLATMALGYAACGAAGAALRQMHLPTLQPNLTLSSQPGCR